jgi:hypothetical protein
MIARYAQLASGLLFLLAVSSLEVAACGGSNASTGGGGAGGTGNEGGFGGATVNCDAKEANECGDATSGCIACAEAHACLDQLNMCNASQGCQTYGQCIEKCAQGDDPCVADCASQNGAGSALYQALLNCVICKECSLACVASASACTL